jgi:hypothetical protein
MLALSMAKQVLCLAEYGYDSGWQPRGRKPSHPAWICLVILFASALWAQKAKPLRIALKNGAATVEGRLRGRQQRDYEVEAGASKIVTLQLTAAPDKTIVLKLYTPEGAEMPLQGMGANRWTAEVSKSGDYGISVLRTSIEQGTSVYKLRITIR